MGGGYRNGLFYAFPYLTLGMILSFKKKETKTSHLIICLLISVIFLIIENSILILKYNTDSTILWMSMFPCMFYFIQLLKKINIFLPKSTSLLFRKLSTLIYVSHSIFLILFSKFDNLLYFLLVAVFSILLSLMIIYLSKIKKLSFLKILY